MTNLALRKENLKYSETQGKVSDMTREMATKELVNMVVYKDQLSKRGFDWETENGLRKVADDIMDEICMFHNLKCEEKDDMIYITSNEDVIEFTPSTIVPLNDMSVVVDANYKEVSNNEYFKIENIRNNYDKMTVEQIKDIKESELPLYLAALGKDKYNELIKKRYYTSDDIIIDNIINNKYKNLPQALKNIISDTELIKDAFDILLKLHTNAISVEEFSKEFGTLLNTVKIKKQQQVENINPQNKYTASVPFVVPDMNKYVDVHGVELFKLTDGTYRYFDQLSEADKAYIESKRNNNGNTLPIIQQLKDSERPVVTIFTNIVQPNNNTTNTQQSLDVTNTQQTSNATNTQQPLDVTNTQQSLDVTNTQLVDQESLEILNRYSKETPSLKSIVNKFTENGTQINLRYDPAMDTIVIISPQHDRYYYLDFHGTCYDEEEKLLIPIDGNIYVLDSENDLQLLVDYDNGLKTDSDIKTESIISDKVANLAKRVALNSFPRIDDRYEFFEEVLPEYMSKINSNRMFICIQNQFKDICNFILVDKESLLNILSNDITIIEVKNAIVTLKHITRSELNLLVNKK